MPRRISVTVSALVLLVACTGTDEVDSTSGPSTSSSPESAWSSVTFDAEGVTGQQPSLIVDEEGRVAAIYQRELIPDSYEIVLSSCEEPSCETVNQSVLASGRYWISDAGVSADGSLFTGSWDSGEGMPMAVWWCPDWECASPTRTETEYAGVALNTTSRGLPLIAYAEFSESGYDLTIGFCDDPACSTHQPVLVYESRQEGWSNPSHLVRLPDGSPVLFFRPASGFEQGIWDVIVCDDPGCSTSKVHHQTEAWTEIPSGDPSLPWTVYTTGTEIHLLSCVDSACAEISDKLLFTVDDAQVQLDAKATYLHDDLVVLIRHASGFNEDDFADYEVDLFKCADGRACTEVSNLPFSKGNYFDIAAIGEDELAIAIQTGRAWLCIEECADPKDELSQLTVYFTNPTD
jgi:hypothetical protein